jgi:RNA polymerase sigma-70 factor, ECF subfamily
MSKPRETRPANGSADARDAQTCESHLVSLLRQGDEAAFRAFVSRYHGALLRLALIFAPERSVAEEVVQDTWLAVINGLSHFDGRSSLKTWMFRILANQARTRSKREARCVPFSSLADSESPSDPELVVDQSRFASDGAWADPPSSWRPDTPETSLLLAELADFLNRAVAELPKRQRAVVILRDMEGLNASEVCNILGLSETNQRVLLHRGRSALRSACERYLAMK